MFRFILGVYIFSLFYNIPIANIGQELKLYDIIMPLILFQFVNNKDGILDFFKVDVVSKAIIRFCLWCSFTFLFTCVVNVVGENIKWIFQSSSYLFHLWGFGVATIFLRKDFLIDRKYFEKTLQFVLILGLLETIIIIGQNFGVVPYLWSRNYFDAYGDTSLSGTLGPNRVVPGSAMFLLFVLCISVITAKQSYRFNRPMAILVAINCLLVVGLAGSRTAYVSIGTFLLVMTIFTPTSVLKFAIPAVAIGLLVAASFNLEKLNERLSFMLEYRIFDPFEKVEAVGNLDYYDQIGSGRKGKLTKAVEYLLEYPWLLPFGQGFLNLKYMNVGPEGKSIGPTRKMKDGNSAHNLYAQMIIENGLVGLVLYLSVLFSFLRGEWRNRNTYVLTALVIAVLVNIFFGENFYVYRTSFGLLGLLLLVATLVDFRRMNSAFLEQKDD
ncbi:MAG TPA: O-antigen ligase family protein [Phnomibacter sp.]|nr:O-antigen ligase family protein [Phnomibacter sp.]